MESTALMEVMDFLAKEGILSLMTEFVCDKDNAVASIFKADARLQHITIRYDPGKPFTDWKCIVWT
jgi:hypothetical protein